MVYFQTNSEPSHQSSLVKSILEQKQLGLNIDFLLSSGGKTILVHSFIIRNACPMLNVLLNSTCSCSQPNVIILPQRYSTILPNFVSLLYTGSSTMPKEMVPQLKELAELLHVTNISLDDNKTIVDQSAVNEEVTDGIHENRSNVLKLSTNIAQKNQKSFKLSLPKSRIARNYSSLKHVQQLEGFHGLVQEEYNKCPVGQYAGPYDQNGKLSLKIQLEKSTLNYESYSEFVHSETMSCREFCVKKKL